MSPVLHLGVFVGSRPQVLAARPSTRPSVVLSLLGVCRLSYQSHRNPATNQCVDGTREQCQGGARFKIGYVTRTAFIVRIEHKLLGDSCEPHECPPRDLREAYTTRSICRAVL